MTIYTVSGGSRARKRCSPGSMIMSRSGGIQTDLVSIVIYAEMKNFGGDEVVRLKLEMRFFFNVLQDPRVRKGENDRIVTTLYVDFVTAGRNCGFCDVKGENTAGQILKIFIGAVKSKIR